MGGRQSDGVEVEVEVCELWRSTVRRMVRVTEVQLAAGVVRDQPGCGARAGVSLG